MINFPKIDQFSFKEAFNNNSGKTEMSLICALLIITTGCVGFIWALAIKLEIAMNMSVAFTTLGAGLLGIRRFTSDKSLTLMDNTDSPSKPIPDATN